MTEEEEKKVVTKYGKCKRDFYIHLRPVTMDLQCPGPNKYSVQYMPVFYKTKKVRELMRTQQLGVAKYLW